MHERTFVNGLMRAVSWQATYARTRCKMQPKHASMLQSSFPSSLADVKILRLLQQSIEMIQSSLFSFFHPFPGGKKMKAKLLYFIKCQEPSAAAAMRRN